MGSRLRWGILGTGAIAGTFAKALPHARRGELVAVASRDGDRARNFAARHGVPRAYTGYEALLEDPNVDAVYIATPHREHVPWVRRAAAQRKHVLCEKPLATSYADAASVIEACAKSGVHLMEAYMYRCHPQTHRVMGLVANGAIGQVRFVDARFSYLQPYSDKERLWSNEGAGGGILDVGGYPVTFACAVAAAAHGRTGLTEPVSVSGLATLHEATGVDGFAAAVLKFPDGLIAQVCAGISVETDWRAKIFGTAGWLEIAEPWLPAVEGGTTELTLHRGGGREETICVECDCWLYAREADDFAAAVLDSTELPVTASDTLITMRTLDSWRQAVGLKYAFEKPETLLVLDERSSCIPL